MTADFMTKFQVQVCGRKRCKNSHDCFCTNGCADYQVIFNVTQLKNCGVELGGLPLAQPQHGQWQTRRSRLAVNSCERGRRMNGLPRWSKSLATLIFAAALPAHAETNWPQFRGPGSKGVATGDGLPDRWSATENVAWKTDLPGRGWSSPIVWGNRVFLTTVVNTGTSEEPKKGLYFGGNRPMPPESIHQWKVLCLDLESGRIMWERQIHEGQPQSAIHLKNSFASETPVTDGKHVFCYFGNIGIFCFDFDGNEVWRKKVEPRQTRFGWGTASSPVLHGDRLYVVNDNDDDSYLLSLEKQIGR